MNNTLLGFIKKELTQTLRDKRMRIVLFVMPIIQLSLFGIAISNEIKHIKLAVQAHPNDHVLQHIYTNALQSKWFIPAKQTTQDPYTLIESGDADVVLLSTPAGLTHDLGKNNGQLQVLINASNVTKAQAIEGYLSAITNTTIQSELKTTTPPSPIAISTRILFNPDLRTALFMVPGTMCMVMIVTTMVLANIAIVREKEMGTFEMLISTPITKAEIILGKTIPYIILGMSNFPLILGVAVIGFGVPMRGSLLLLLLAVFCFVCTSVALGTLISTYVKNQQQATLGGFLIMMPMVMFSGLMFPIENMPSSIKWLAHINPLAHFIGIVRNIMIKGGGAHYVTLHTGILVLTATIVITVSYRRFHTTL
jgi:ABC-2 type transport system permease protein